MATKSFSNDEAELCMICGRLNVSNRRTIMSSMCFRSSRPDHWVQPRPYRDASQRYMTHGRVLPMEQPGFFARLLGFD